MTLSKSIELKDARIEHCGKIGRLGGKCFKPVGLLCIILLLFMSERAALGATIVAASTSATDVQAAINTAKNGDTVIVPSGSATWSSELANNGKAITLIGGGGTNGVTMITQGSSAGDIVGFDSPFTINDFTWIEQNSSAVLMKFNCASNSFWRFCSNQVYCINGIWVYQTGKGSGLIDNNYFQFGQEDVWNPVGNNDGAPLYGDGGNGVGNWAYGTSYGATNYLYIEHNAVYSTSTASARPDGPLDAYGGAKFVLRYNSFTNCGMGGWHGTDSGSYISTHSYEIYGNYCYYTAAQPGWDYVFNSRGGTGLIFSNVVAGVNLPGHGFLQLWNNRAPGGACSQTGNCSPWDVMTGSNPYDGNTDSTGYPGLGQQGETGPIGGYVLTGTGTHSTQVLSPTYMWGNNTATIALVTTSDSTIQYGRDFYTNAPTYSNGTFANFPGSAGMSYTPLAYPYPLGGGTQPPATNPPQITVQPVNSSVTTGQTATFNVTASGSGTLTYQWYWYGTNVAGATSSSWTTPATVLGNSNSVVYVTIGNAYGSVTSSIAYLYVTGGVAPTIAAGPTSRTNAVGDSTTFNVTANGTAPLAYQWRFNSAAIANATSSNYTIAPVGTNNAGGYTVIVTNSYGSVTSAVANLTVTNSIQTVHYYYVAPNGSDSTGNGSIGSPWATVDHATSLMSGGDVLYIRGGTYSQIFDIYGPSGSASYPTIVEAYPGETPIFNANNITGGAHSIDGLSWLVVSGLTIVSNNIGMIVGYAGACTNVVLTNMVFADIGQQGLQIEHNSYNVALINSVVHDTGLWIYNGEGLYIGEGDSSGILDNSHNITITGCTVSNTADEGIEVKPGTYNVTVQNCVVHHCNWPQNQYGVNGGAIEVDEEGTYNYYSSNPNHVIRNNLVYDTPMGIRAGNGGQYYNNIIYGTTNNQAGLLINNNDGDTWTRYVYNNTVDDPTASAIVYSSGTASILNNIGTSGTYNLAMNNAYFVNEAAHNYHLIAGSAPIQAGSNLFSVVPTDFDGNSRPSTGPFDIGAYQYEAADVVLPPTNLHVASSQ